MTFIQIHTCKRSKKLAHPFSCNFFLLIWIQFSLLPQPVLVSKLILNMIHVISIQGREVYLCDFIRYTFNIGLCMDAYELICFKLVIMLDKTKVYSISMIPG